MIPVLVTLIQNAALLLAMMVVFDLVTSRKTVYGQWGSKAVAGIILGGLCIGLMLASFQLETGIIFDTRSVLLSLSGLFLGPIPTVLAMVIGSVYRLMMGGIAALPGTGVILATGTVGILWRHYRKGRLEDISFRELYLFGVLVHIIMLVIMLTLPWEAAMRVIAGIGLPVMVIYPIATIALGWLLSNRVQRENATNILMASEERYRTIINVAPVGIAIIQYGKIVFVNPGVLGIFGARTAEQLVGRPVSTIIHRDNLEESLKRKQRLLRGEKVSYPVEDKYIRLDGAVIDVEVRATLIDFRNEPAVQIIINDITERKRLRQELIELNAQLELKVKQRTILLEEANKELEAFSYSVSHDLRAPLRHINGYVDLLNQKYAEVLDEKARHYLNTITGASRTMGNLIDDLLQFSRTGRKELSSSEIDLNLLLKEVLNELDPVVKDREINWEIQALPKVHGDYNLLKLVWTNLIDNAVKYTHKQPSAKISVGYKPEMENFVFCVSDNGVGFDMKYAHKLFGVFQRLHAQEEFEGTGIGLANVQRIIHKHSGQVWAEAEKDKGAAFYFSLPKSEGK
jgi:PAS domain S-box-containing protein